MSEDKALNSQGICVEEKQELLTGEALRNYKRSQFLQKVRICLQAQTDEELDQLIQDLQDNSF